VPIRARIAVVGFGVTTKDCRHKMLQMAIALDQRFSWRSIEPTGSSADPLAQSQAFAILSLTSDTEPRLKLPSFTFPSLLRVVFIDSLPLSGND
jgi:hypothetical protein